MTAAHHEGDRPRVDRGEPPDLRAVRELVRTHCGFDPGPLDPPARLDGLGLLGLALLRLVVGLEATYQVDLPADLVSAVDTVDELAWFVATRWGQEGPDAT